jgi:hypothetical protein
MNSFTSLVASTDRMQQQDWMTCSKVPFIKTLSPDSSVAIKKEKR